VYLKKFKYFLPFLAFMLSIMLWALSCSKAKFVFGSENDSKSKAVVLAWNNLYLELDRYTEGYYPPVSARNFAYISLSAFEAVQPILQNGESLNNSFSGLDLPVYNSNDKYEMSELLNSAYASSFRQYFQTAPQNYFSKINELEEKIHNSNEHLNPKRTSLNSRKYGLLVSNAVYLWSGTDTYGHEAYNHLYDENLTLPGRRDSWAAYSSDIKKPILPNWGKVRPFLLKTNDVEVKPPLPYSEEPSSKMYKEALALYTMSMPLSEDNKWIAEFWSDDHRGLTFSPPARWISIANQIVEHEDISINKILELYLSLGFALCDASIITWKAKYEYARERPQQYINRVISKDWKPFHENPTFPSYPSGHSVFGAAASVVLAKYFGDNYHFVDKSHINRKEFHGKPRSFNSFKEMAIENAYSRNAIGVHSRNDCEEGLRIGYIIGKRISNLTITTENIVDTD